MHATKRVLLVASVLFALPLAPPARADLFTFSTGIPDARLGTASGGSGALEAESADDFITTAPTSLTGGSFFGMLPSGTSLSDVAVMTVEIYRVFPLDSVVGATSGPPNFATSRVPTRVNSPSDFDFDDRSTATGDLTFQCTVLSTSFTVANTVLGTGIHPIPGETTGGDGPGSGEEVRCDVTFTTPFLLPPEHYFFVPQVTLTNGAPFLWLSAARPIVPPGTPLTPDLQTWIRNASLEPDWLRVGTDIIGGTTFNAAFALTGETTATVPEPATLALLLVAFAATVAARGRAALGGLLASSMKRARISHRSAPLR